MGKGFILFLGGVGKGSRVRDKTDLYAFLAPQRLAVVSSVSEQNKPEVALVGIAVTPALELIFDTLNTTRKYRNFKQNPHVALVIGWDGEITLQYEGVARELSGAERAAYEAVYFAAFPDGRERESRPGIAYFCITPTWLRLNDCSQASPIVAEFSWEQGTR